MFDIKYMKLNFRIKFEKCGKLPKYKMSALRGGMGQVLMKKFCLEDKPNCNNCLLNERCAVNGILSPKIETNLPFMKNVQTSHSGLVIECIDFREEFFQEDILEFSVLLFNNIFNYGGHIIYAFDALGKTGLGKNRLKFSLLEVLNEENKPIFKDGVLFKENIKPSTVLDYVQKRKRELSSIDGIEFILPLRFVKQGKLTDEINSKDLIIALQRRIAILNAVSGKTVDIDVDNVDNFIESTNLYWTENKRYSNRQKAKMSLGGVLGTIKFNENVELIKDLLIAGELVHIGKNTTFGLGKYIINS